MTKEQVFETITKAGYFYLATMDGKAPRVRAMMLYKADKDGIVFHTSKIKDVYNQLKANPLAEICVNDQASGLQLRVSGEFLETEDNALKNEILNHPSREFLRGMKAAMPEGAFEKTFAVFCMKKGKAVTWDMASNMKPKTEIQL